MICCTVCGSWYPLVGSDRLDICPPCVDLNFAGAAPPLNIHSPMAREILDAYVDSAHTLTPRQVAAMARMAEVWRRSERQDEP